MGYICQIKCEAPGCSHVSQGTGETPLAAKQRTRFLFEKHLVGSHKVPQSEANIQAALADGDVTPDEEREAQ